MKKTILGVDLGIASVGWCLVEANDDDQRADNKIIAAGVRIFTKAEHPKTGSSLALPRRQARGTRRVIARKRKRMLTIKYLLMKHLELKKSDLFAQSNEDSETIYKAKNKQDVWQLRKEGLERKLSNQELARVLTHIAKRRGYKSNAKQEKDEEGKKVLAAITKNKERLQGKTIGAVFYEEQQQSYEKEARLNKIRNTKDVYTHCVDRGMLEEELNTLFERQKTLGKHIDETLLESYKQAAFHQRPLKSIAHMVGYCTLEPKQKRAPKQAYSAELFRALTEIINRTSLVDANTGERIRSILEYPAPDMLLTPYQILEQALHTNKEVSYNKLRKIFNIPDHVTFEALNYAPNVEREKPLPSYQKLADIVKTIRGKETVEALDTADINAISYIPKDKSGKENSNEKDRKRHRYLKNYADLKRALKLDHEYEFAELKYPETLTLAENIKRVEAKKCCALEGYHKIKSELDKIKSKLDETTFEQIFQNKTLFNAICRILTEEKDSDKTAKRIKEKLPSNDFSEQAQATIAEAIQDISFTHFASLSLLAIDNILPFMKAGKRYDEACQKAGYHHSKIHTDTPKKHLRKLNKQEQYQLTNPVVKRCFSQFRKVLNAIIKKHGQFDSMHIELARELKNSAKKREQIEEGQKAFKSQKETIEEQLREELGRAPSGKELLKFRLYEEQKTKCVYSYKSIDRERLLTDDQYAEVDHILPRSRTFDNSLHNKVLVLKDSNQQKRNQTPFEYIGKSDEQSSEWQEFKQFVNSLGIKGMKKMRLFNTNLPKRTGDQLTNDDLNDENSFIARNLVDTQFLARFTKNFVEKNLQFKENDTIKQKVQVRSGAITSQLRYVWGLATKDRDSHLHHAEDAVIIAFSTQSEVQRMSKYAAQIEEYKYKSTEEKNRLKTLKSTPPIEKNLLENTIKEIFVSHAPRRKVTGAAHKDTLYSATTYQVTEKDDKTGKRKIKSELTGATKLYPQKLNNGKALAENESMPRIDIFQHKDNKKFYIVPIYVADFVKNTLPNLAIVSGNDKDGNKKPWLEMDDNYQFIASFYKKDLIEVCFKKKESVFGYYSACDSSTSNIDVEHPQGVIEGNYLEKGKKGEKLTTLVKRSMGIQGASEIRKYQVSPLGEVTPVTLPEKRIGTKQQLRYQRV